MIELTLAVLKAGVATSLFDQHTDAPARVGARRNDGPRQVKLGKGTLMNYRFRLILLIVAIGCSAGCADPLLPVTVWGSKGVEPGQFLYIEDFAVSQDGYLMVTDALRADVQRFTTTGDFVDSFGSNETGATLLEKPEGIGVDTDGNIWVGDYLSGYLQKYTPDLEHQATYSGPGSDEGMTLESEFMTIYQGRLFIAEAGNHRISVFNVQGDFEFSFGTPGALEGQLSRPEAVKQDTQGRLVVSDFGNDRIQIFDTQGKFLDGFGTRGSEPGEFRKPTGIAIDANNNIYVADSGNNRIQVFSSNGVFLYQLGSSGSLHGQFENLHGLIIIDNHLFVGDTGNHRIQKFSLNQ